MADRRLLVTSGEGKCAERASALAPALQIAWQRDGGWADGIGAPTATMVPGAALGRRRRRRYRWRQAPCARSSIDHGAGRWPSGQRIAAAEHANHHSASTTVSVNSGGHGGIAWYCHRRHSILGAGGGGERVHSSPTMPRVPLAGCFSVICDSLGLSWLRIVRQHATDRGRRAGMELRGQAAIVTGGGVYWRRNRARRWPRPGRVQRCWTWTAPRRRGAARLSAAWTATCDVADAAAADRGCGAGGRGARAGAAAGGLRGIGPAARIIGRDGAMPLERFETGDRINLIGTFNMLRRRPRR